MERTTYGAFERFLYFFLIPMIYSSVLVFVLFVIFNEDVRDSVLRTANNIPIIRELVPDAKEEAGGADGLPPLEVVQAQREAKERIEALEAQLKSAIETSRKKDDEIEALEARIAELEAELEEEVLSAEEYEQHIQSLSNMYASMNPSKAAPILENLMAGEIALILSRLSADDQAAILQRMNPQIAAQATRKLKDMQRSENIEIAALQDRIALLEEEIASRAQTLTTEQLAQTIAEMDTGSAATLLLEMSSTNEAQVIDILRAMNNASRSAVISAISDEDSARAARLTARLSG